MKKQVLTPQERLEKIKKHISKLEKQLTHLTDASDEDEKDERRPFSIEEEAKKFETEIKDSFYWRAVNPVTREGSEEGEELELYATIGDILITKIVTHEGPFCYDEYEAWYRFEDIKDNGEALRNDDYEPFQSLLEFKQFVRNKQEYYCNVENRLGFPDDDN